MKLNADVRAAEMRQLAAGSYKLKQDRREWEMGSGGQLYIPTYMHLLIKNVNKIAFECEIAAGCERSLNAK